MAERRMFAKTIIDSDSFLDMPLSAQALYMHLSMRADDDGFVNNPKRIQRMIGASEDDLRLLHAKSFILSFETGVIVIKHWKINNYLRNDRYKPTVYQEEKKALGEKENGAYTLLDNIGIPNGYQTDTQYRLGKDSKGKYRLGKDSIGKESTLNHLTDGMSDKSDTIQAIVDEYNSICSSFPKVTKISETRRKAIRARLKQYSRDEFTTLFEKAEASHFLKGGNNRNWCANFDWLIKDANMAKVLDGNYDKGKASSGSAYIDAINNRVDVVDTWLTGKEE